MRRNLVSLLVFFLVMLTVTARDKWDNKTVKIKGMRVLVFTKNGKGFVHENIPYSAAALQKLGQENGFAVDTTSNATLFTEENLKKYNALIFSNTNNQVFDTEAQKVALMRYVQAGGGIVGIHIACGTERQWPWFKQMIGGSFLMHPKFQEFTVLPVDAKHPSVAVVPAVWKVQDECYFLKDMNPTMRVLMVADTKKLRETNELPNTFGQFVPTVWCNNFDGGRQWNTTLGHHKDAYSNPVFMQHILGGLKWAAAKKLDYSKAYAVKSEHYILN